MGTEFVNRWVTEFNIAVKISKEVAMHLCLFPQILKVIAEPWFPGLTFKTLSFMWVQLPFPVLSHIGSTSNTSWHQYVTSYAGSLHIELWRDAWKLQSDYLWAGFAEHIAKVTKSAIELRLFSSERPSNHQNREMNPLTQCLLFGKTETNSGREITERIRDKAEYERRQNTKRSRKKSDVVIKYLFYVVLPVVLYGCETWSLH
jgi:hypothetical protein